MSVLCATARLLLGICFKRIHDHGARWWRFSLWVAVSVTALTWGLFLAASVVWFGYYDWNTLILLVCLAGTAPVSLASFTPALRLLVVFQILFCGPMIVANAYTGGVVGYSMAAVFSWYLGFMLMFARSLNAEYLDSLNREEIDLARRTAEEANRAKSELLAQISHEIRTPLNTIVGMAYLALNTPDAEERREYVETTLESSAFLVRLLNELLDASKIESGRLRLECRPFDRRRMIAGVVAAFRAEAERKGLSLTVEIAPKVPAFVAGDIGRVRQVLVNILSNATKFTERGRIEVRVRSAGVDAGSVTLHFSVTDTGIGIPARRHQAIFEPFEQGDPSTFRHYGGTGLGLAICSRLITLMDGTISVSSEPGAGSTFRWSMRLRESQAPETAGDHHFPEPQSVCAPARVTGARVLVAEDNLMAQLLMRRLLELRHHSVTIASNGYQALEALEKEPFDLILMDVQMPAMDGIETTARFAAGNSGSEATPRSSPSLPTPERAPAKSAFGRA